MATSNRDQDELRAAVRKAVAALARAEQAVEKRRSDLAEAVSAASKGDIKPGELIHMTGKSAETIRQWRGDRRRPPTTGSFKKAVDDQSAAN